MLSGPIPDVSMSMDGACHVICYFFGDDDCVVRVSDTHVPNENVQALHLAQKMIRLKSLV